MVIFYYAAGYSDKTFVAGFYIDNRLSNAFKKFYGRHIDLLGEYTRDIWQMFADAFLIVFFYLFVYRVPVGFDQMLIS